MNIQLIQVLSDFWQLVIDWNNRNITDEEELVDNLMNIHEELGKAINSWKGK
jgi:hypothetical protein